MSEDDLFEAAGLVPVSRKGLTCFYSNGCEEVVHDYVLRDGGTRFNVCPDHVVWVACMILWAKKHNVTTYTHWALGRCNICQNITECRKTANVFQCESCVVQEILGETKKSAVKR